MAWGLPKLPGLTFKDPTKTQHHLCNSLYFYQGHAFQSPTVRAPGGANTDVDSNAFSLPEDSCNYDPSLTYGRVKQPALPLVVPHYAHYDKKCLNFRSFFKQPVFDSPIENTRVRLVNLIYFLEDDTLSVAEPTIKNSGIWQGKLVKRSKIPKNDAGEFWHWKDLDVGKDICIYGKVFHTCSCDLFTREWMESQGIEVSKDEELPTDQYMEKEMWKTRPIPHKPKAKEDPLGRFLEYDGKVLAFEAVWDNRDMPFGELGKYKLLYFLQDDTIAIKELGEDSAGKDPFPMLLKKTKLPKKWKEKPLDFPSIVLEMSEEEVTEYYAPRDLIVGETVYLLGRRFLICDADSFTRHYFKVMLDIQQPPAVKIGRKTKKEFTKALPPHIGIGSPEDTLQSCFGLMPHKPHKDIVKYNLNANKFLRYLCELDYVHPEDAGRRFVLSYSLADGTIKIGEIARRNSGIKEGKFLKPMKLELPESDHNFPTYYTPDKFFIGAIIPVFKHRFRMIGCDLYVYRYMSANPEKFPQEVIDNVRNYHMREGNLKDELESAAREEHAAETHAQLVRMGADAVAEPSAMERCLNALDVVEGSASPGAAMPATPPATTDMMAYDDMLRTNRQSAPTCEDVAPLKGILKSGAARDDHQKVVCFTGPETAHPPRTTFSPYPPGTQPPFDEDADYCDRYKDPGWKERKERRKRNECAYEITPNRTTMMDVEPPEPEKKTIPGYLGTYNVDCKKVPEHARLSPDAYEKVKALRRDVPEISPAAARVAGYPRLPHPPVKACVVPPADPTGPCAPYKPEDVAFACPHVEPIPPCCDPNERGDEHTKL